MPDSEPDPRETAAELRITRVSALNNYDLVAVVTYLLAKHPDTFPPMLNLGKEFVAKGVTFERPIMNYATLWQLRPSAAR